MFYSGVCAVYNTGAVAALVVDDLWYGEFDSFSGVEFDGVFVGVVEEIVCGIWNNWRSADISVSDV